VGGGGGGGGAGGSPGLVFVSGVEAAPFPLGFSSQPNMAKVLQNTKPRRRIRMKYTSQNKED
jgi:hypothetical protein